VNSKKFEILQIAQNLSFLCRAEYKLFRFDILQYCRIRYYKQLGFFSEFFKTSKCQILKSSKAGSIELVHRIDFLLEAYTYVGAFVEWQELIRYSSRRNMLLQIKL
jgi:hypothetical protein